MDTKSPDGLKTKSVAPSPSFEELAAQQGVGPVRDLNALFGKRYASDESAEEFSAILRSWRSEGNTIRPPQ